MDALTELLMPSRLTHVVDVGANPHDGGTPPYSLMLSAGICHVTGFEPQHQALATLQHTCGPNELYLPYAVGDGSPRTLKICRASGMTSLLEPNPVTLGLFPSLQPSAEVIRRIPVDTRRLDDIEEIEHLDLLKIDIQGGELPVFQNGTTKLAETVAIQTEVSFMTWYENQPPFGEVDLELRHQGFVPHCFTEVRGRRIGNFTVGGVTPQRLNQLTEADIVYVRDFTRPGAMTDEQLKHLALIAHHCYGSFDLAFQCLEVLEHRNSLEAGSTQRYVGN